MEKFCIFLKAFAKAIIFSSVVVGNSVTDLQVDNGNTKSVNSTFTASATITATAFLPFAWNLGVNALVAGQYDDTTSQVMCARRAASAFYCPSTAATGTFSTNVTYGPLTFGEKVLSVDSGVTTLNSLTINVTYCGNLTGVATVGVKKDVPANVGYQSIHVFQCADGYTGENQTGICQEDATWNVTTSLCQQITTTPAATTTSAGATAFGSFWNGSPLVMLFVFVVCNHI